MSSEEYAEQAHQLYLDGRYDEALDLITNALEVFPFSTDLHIGAGYARLAREEFAWARLAFEQAVSLEPNHEDALAGLGETLLKLGHRGRGIECFDRILELGFAEDHDLMLQIGRALFREGEYDHARRIFDLTLTAHRESWEAAACLAYAVHRLGDDESAIHWLRRSVELNDEDPEVHIYLGNLLYDRGDFEQAMAHYEKTRPIDHFEELAMWRLIELKKSRYELEDDDPELRPWLDRFRALAETLSADDYLLAEIENRVEGAIRDPQQLDFFGTMLRELQGMKKRGRAEQHRVALSDGTTYTGSWDDIVLQMKQDDREWAGCSVDDYMRSIARRRQQETGILIPVTDAESFLRGIAAAGLATITS